MATSLEDLPEDFIEQESDHDMTEKKVHFSDEVSEYEPEFDTTDPEFTQVIYDQVKEPLLVVIILFMLNNGSIAKLIRHSPLRSLDGSYQLAAGMALIGGILFAILKNLI